MGINVSARKTICFGAALDVGLILEQKSVRVFLPKYLIDREQKFQHNVRLDWSRNKRKTLGAFFPSIADNN